MDKDCGRGPRNCRNTYSGKQDLTWFIFCHLVIEKAIKAHYVKSTGENAPRTHNIMYLSDRAGLSFDEESQIFMGILMKYQLEGRYPDYNPALPERKKIIDYFDKTKNLFQWLKKKL